MIELTDKNNILKTYEIYKHCMFMPSEEKINKKTDQFLKDNSVKIFACFNQNEMVGVIVFSFVGQRKIQIIGISVHPSFRNNDIGSYMIDKVINDYSLLSVYAETDNDAVGFYKKYGFNITKVFETHYGKTIVRYKCEFKK